MVIAEPIAIYRGLIPPKGVQYQINTVTVRGKKHVTQCMFLCVFGQWFFRKWNKKRREKVARRDNYTQRMAVINEETKAWAQAGKVMPAKLVVENERVIFPQFKTLYVRYGQPL